MTGTISDRTRDEMLHLLEELNSRGMTLVLITHDAALGSRARRHIRTLDGRVEA